MKGAIVLILMLCLWFITAQSIEAIWYDLSKKDTIYLQNIIWTIERKWIDHNKIETSFAPYLDYFPSNSRQYKLLHEIYNQIKTHKKNVSDTTQHHSQAFINLLWEQF